MARYVNNVVITKTEDGKRVYSSAIPEYSTIDLIEYTYEARVGDRWDTLAYKYLGSPTLWYVLASANSSVNGSIFVKPGTLITIPQIY